MSGHALWAARLCARSRLVDCFKAVIIIENRYE